MEMASSVKYGEGKATSLGFDMQTVGKDLAYTLRNETKFWHDDVAYGGSLEAQLRDKNHPLGHSLSMLGISVMDWHGNLVVGCNLQSQIPIGRSCRLIDKHGAGWNRQPTVKSDEIWSVLVQHANKVVNSQGSTVSWKLKSHGTVIKGAIVTEVESMTTVTSSQQQWLDPSFQLNVPLVMWIRFIIRDLTGTLILLLSWLKPNATPPSQL
ncbi:translocon at the outer envelope membrane of chloroplasts [Trifolium repens]|nr:translocon at the outer envelope membrane of chloroplasts [Trifolium repens]